MESSGPRRSRVLEVLGYCLEDGGTGGTDVDHIWAAVENGTLLRWSADRGLRLSPIHRCLFPERGALMQATSGLLVV